uniref:Uncharacterized protein n=1 Tax=Aegilops tauschii subsp. strangulata TaxID=200361 RepID=A0A453QN95_AEGTS
VLLDDLFKTKFLDCSSGSSVRLGPFAYVIFLKKAIYSYSCS